MKHITLSTSRLQYTPTSHIAQQCESRTITGDEARTLVKSLYSRVKAPIQKEIHKIKCYDENHPSINKLEMKLRALNAHLKTIDNEDITLTLLTPKTQWLC